MSPGVSDMLQPWLGSAALREHVHEYKPPAAARSSDGQPATGTLPVSMHLAEGTLKNLALISMVFLAGVCPLLLTGCVNTKRGDTVYRVNASSFENEKIIRRKLWHVGKAVEDVRLRYGLEDITVKVRIAELGGLGQAQPAFSGLADVSGARIVLSERLFTEEHPEIDMIITGLLAHELMHALQYARMTKGDLAMLGRRYQLMMRNPDGPQREWVRAFERFTDMATIKFGYGEELTHQKRASEANLAANDPSQVWDFYLTEPEIREFMADPDLLDREIEAAVDVLALSSFRRMLEITLEFDDDGDFIPLRRR